MNLIACTHKRALKWPQCNIKLVKSELDVALAGTTTVITFAKTGGSVRALSAHDRMGVSLPGDVVCSHWDHSPLAAHLLWDVAHTLYIHARMYLHNAECIAALLRCDYYRESFCEEASTKKGLRVFRKVKTLSIEQDRGLDGWSFCIPTGGSQAAQLNLCVERIMSLNVPESEIILCGEPAQDFLYRDRVRIVGEDIAGKPVHITRKKNHLAQMARYPNLCILHDRVLLPHEFMQAVVRFGDDYPFTGFTSFWFADSWRAVPRRYSDFCVGQFVPDVLRGVNRPGRHDLHQFERMRFVAQHPARAMFGHEYLTGSLYLCKRSLWQFLPQNEALFWGEYEDVEQGIRAAVAGIPSRINPYAFTETLSYRTIFHHYGATVGFSEKGCVIRERAPMEIWGFPRKPTLNMTQKQGMERLADFARRYTGGDESVRMAAVGRVSGLARFRLITRLLWRAQGDISTLVSDWFRLVLCESNIPIEAESLQGMLDSTLSNEQKKIFLLRHVTLTRQLYNNFLTTPYGPESSGEQHQASWKQTVGAYISTLWLIYFSQQTSFRLTGRELFRMIRTIRRRYAR